MPIRVQSVFLPKTLTVLRGYSARQMGSDLLAGLTVGIVALPLALAFGIASIPESVARDAGISPPLAGLVTAVVAGLLISLLGGTRVSIGGPTGAFIVIIYAIAAKHGYDGLVAATVLAGIALVALGAARLGAMIKYIPYPVTTGFTSGIAVIIFAGQIKDLFGLTPHGQADPMPPEFLARMAWFANHIETVHWSAAAMGVACAAAILLWPRAFGRRIPGPIAVLVLATVATHALGLGVETIRDRFGEIPSGFPAPRMPALHLEQLPELVGPALTIAMLAAIESLLCAVVADGMLGTRHRSNTELIAQGVANIATPLFGGIPATGAIARTATNIQAGGRTPVSGMVHALTLLVIMLAAGRYASLVPLPALAAVLVVVAWNMSEAPRFIWLLRGPHQDALVLLATFGLTVFTDLTIAVGVGMVMASLLFMKRMADVTSIGAVTGGSVDIRANVPEPNGARAPTAPRDVEIYDINGPFFFGAAYKLRETLDSLGRPPRVLILNMPNVLAMDATGLHALEEMRRRCVKDGTHLVIAGVHAQPVHEFAKSGLLDAFGDENLVGTVEEALARAGEILETARPPAGPPKHAPIGA